MRSNFTIEMAKREILKNRKPKQRKYTVREPIYLICDKGTYTIQDKNGKVIERPETYQEAVMVLQALDELDNDELLEVINNGLLN